MLDLLQFVVMHVVEQIYNNRSKWCGVGGWYYSFLIKANLRATERFLPYGITQCYLPPDTDKRAQPNPSQINWYSIHLPRRDGRLS